MKKSLLWMMAALAPILLINPISAQETSSPAAEKTVEAKKPSLTYYYLDG